MEYDKILDIVGGFGNYQKLFVFLLAIPSVYNGMTTFMQNFIFGEHAHRCRIPNDPTDTYSSIGEIASNTTTGLSIYNVTECSIYTNGSLSPCHEFVFDTSVYTATLTSKFSIVCEHRIYRAHILMCHYVGLLVGSFTGGFVADICGRKIILGSSILMLAVATGIRPWIPSLVGIAILELLNGIGSMLAYNMPFLLALEMVEPKKRLFASFCVYISYCIGNYILLVLAYFIRDWTHLVWTISLLTATYTIVILFIKESPRWLLIRGRTKEAIEILQKTADFNGKDVVLAEETVVITEEKRVSFVGFVKELLKSKVLMYRLAVLCLNWFAVALAYYGIGMNVAKFSGDVYGNFAASSSAETVAILFCWVTTNRFGRKKLLTTSMILAGVTCLCTIFTTMYATDDDAWATTLLAMLGRFFITIGFFVVYLFTAELFPTVLRSSSVGFCSTIGRIGSIASAYIGELGTLVKTDWGQSLPLIIFGVVSLLGGILSLTLPDTTHTMLPSTVQNAAEITRLKSRDYSSDSNQTELEPISS